MSRQLIGKYQKYLEQQGKKFVEDVDSELAARYKNQGLPESPLIITRMMQQVKLISQLITYIWLHNEEGSEHEEKAKKLNYYFRNTIPDPKWKLPGSLHQELFPDAKEPKTLKHLLGAHIDEDSVEGELLRAVFNPLPKRYQFPIFEELAINYNLVGFEIDTGIFNGWITDPDPNSPSMLHVVIAFPPRPHLSQATVTKEELEDWLTNRNDFLQFMSDNPYIPTCSC